MSGRFNGVMDATLNQARVVIPSYMKSKFSKKAKGRVVITLGPGKSIAIYPLDNWEEYSQKMESGSNQQVELIDYLADFSTEQKIESSGRVKLSKTLLNIAGIQDKLILKGSGKYISLWSPIAHQKKKETDSKKFINLSPKDFRG